MSLLFMLEGPKAGQFVPITDFQEAQRLIDEGKAQSSLANAGAIQKPQRKAKYKTREVRAEDTVTVEAAPIMEPPQPEQNPKQKPRPNRKKKKGKK